jgi:hypothetical protein
MEWNRKGSLAGEHVRTVVFVFLLGSVWAPAAALQAMSDLPPALENAGEAGLDPGMADRQGAAHELESVAADTDPTKPVIFSLRNEFYDLKNGFWKNDMIFRADRAVFEKRGLAGSSRGLLLRADLPIVTFYNGDVTKAGLGDLYGQLLYAPRISGPFFLAVGTGLLAPTATDESLGFGKWVLAPAVVPVYFFPHKGLSYIKIQDWISFAGSPGRPDLHYLTVTPTFLWRLTKRWYALVDGESLTDWEKDGRTSTKAGFLLGLMLSRRVGVSIKAEIPFGANRLGDWTVKSVFFTTKY